MSIGRSKATDAILQMEGDRRCVEGCPHLQMKKRGKKETGYCSFYGTWLREYDLLTGWEACTACIDAGNTEE